jgi:hypothetical protein
MRYNFANVNLVGNMPEDSTDVKAINKTLIEATLKSKKGGVAVTLQERIERIRQVVTPTQPENAYETLSQGAKWNQIWTDWDQGGVNWENWGDFRDR